MSQKVFKIMPRDSKHSLVSLRGKGLIPGIMYGQSLKESIAIQIPLTSLQAIINDSTNMMFPLELEGQVYNCVLREFQPDHLHSQILHVDFQFVKPGEYIKMNIPMNYEGLELLGSKKYILEKALSRILVKGSVDVLPESFMLNVGSLDRGAKIFVRDIELPQGVELLTNLETIIATVQ